MPAKYNGGELSDCGTEGQDLGFEFSAYQQLAFQPISRVSCFADRACGVSVPCALQNCWDLSELLKLLLSCDRLSQEDRFIIACNVSPVLLCCLKLSQCCLKRVSAV